MRDEAKTRALALKRAKDAETAAIIREGAEEANRKRQEELTLYQAQLAEIEGISDDQRRLLSSISLHGIISRACLECQIPLSTAFKWIATNPEYKQLVADARAMSTDRLEQTAIDLATGMNMRPLVSKGKIAGYERIYDTKALLTLLKARKPTEFGNKLDITSNGHTIVKLVDKDAWDSV